MGSLAAHLREELDQASDAANTRTHQRDKAAYLLVDLIDRIGDHGQEQAIRAARDYLRDVYGPDFYDVVQKLGQKLNNP